jgi:hypothetical protein
MAGPVSASRRQTLSAILGAGLLLGLSGAARAGNDELRELFRGARSQAMGGASVAIVDDEESLYLNPAGIGGLTRYGVQYMAVDVDVAQEVVSSLMGGEGSPFSGGLSGDSISAFMGKDTYGRVQITPTILMTNFAFGILMDGQAAVYAENPALPYVTLGYQTTNGIQAAYGVSLFKRRRSQHDLRIGVGAKVLWRRGGYRRLTTLALTQLSSESLAQIAGNWGMGIGADLGVQYVNQLNPKLKLSWGLAWTDIGDTTFSGGEPDPITSNLSMGVGAVWEAGKARVSLAYDYRHMLDETDWRKRNHLGTEIALPVLSLYAGLNQMNLTYGVGFDAWLFRVTALSYAEEIDPYLSQDASRRYMLKLALRAGF